MALHNRTLLGVWAFALVSLLGSPRAFAQQFARVEQVYGGPTNLYEARDEAYNAKVANLLCANDGVLTSFYGSSQAIGWTTESADSYFWNSLCDAGEDCHGSNFKTVVSRAPTDRPYSYGPTPIARFKEIRCGVVDRIKEVSIGSDGFVAGVTEGGRLYFYEATEGKWYDTAYPADFRLPVAHVSVATRDIVWITTTDQRIFRKNLSFGGPVYWAWDQMPGALSQVSVGKDGAVWGVNYAYQIYRFNGVNGWDLVPGALSQISVGNKNNVVGVNWVGQIFRYDSRSGGWRLLNGALSQVAVAGNGIMWGVNSYGMLYSAKRDGLWASVAGYLSQIAAGAGGAAGVDPNGFVYVGMPTTGWVRLAPAGPTPR